MVTKTHVVFSVVTTLWDPGPINGVFVTEIITRSDFFPQPP